MKNIILVLVSIVLFTGCSSKRVFEPNNTQDWEHQGNIGNALIDITTSAGLLENRTLLSKDVGSDAQDITIDEGYRLLANTGDWVISSNVDGLMKLQYIAEKSVVENFDLKKTVATANIKGDILAVVFADNDIALYSIASKELLLNEKIGESVVVDYRTVSPYFTGNLVIFSTLDGKVVVVNTTSMKKLRTVSVSSEDSFNNVIYFDILEEKIIAATPHKILSMSRNEVREKYDIRHVANNGENIYVATKQGELLSLTTDLELNAKLKFPFAHFLGLIAKEDKIYALEKEGYLIVASSDLSTHTVYEVDIDEGFVFVTGDKFFVNDEFISIK